MKAGRFARSWLAIAALAASTCGGASDRSGEFDGPYTAALCGHAVRCGLAPDTDWCARTLYPTIAPFISSIQAGRIRYDPRVGQRCFAAYASQPCTIDGLRALAAVEECHDLLVGTVPQGGACFSDRDCVDRALCQGAAKPGCSPGVCGPARPPRSADGPCKTNDDCLGRGVCSLSYDPQKPASCSPPPDETCGPPGSCTGNRTCVVVRPNFEVRCVSLSRDGEACGLGVLACAGLGSVCREGICRPPGGEGAACEGNFSCRAYAACAGVCVRRPAPGDACIESYVSCSAGACVGGRCTVEGCGPADGGTP